MMSGELSAEQEEQNRENRGYLVEKTAGRLLVPLVFLRRGWSERCDGLIAVHGVHSVASFPASWAMKSEMKSKTQLAVNLLTT
jgi:hypothetical protein